MAELGDLARAVVSSAVPGEEVEVFLTRRRGTAVRVYKGEVESFSSAEPFGAGVRVVVGGRQGFASAGSLEEPVLKETLEEARDNASFAEPDEHVGLAEADDLPRPSLDLYRPETASLSNERKIELALELERAALARDPRVTSGRSISWSDQLFEQAIATTTGIQSYGEESMCVASLGVLAEDEGGQTQTGSGVSYGRAPQDVDLEAAAAEAVTECVRMLGAAKPASATLPCVFTPRVTLQLLGVIGRMLSGEALVKGTTPFADRVEEDIAAGIVSLVDDPTDPASLAAWPDDDEGLASRRNVLIDSGTLKGFLHNTYTGRRAGTGSTGSATRGYASLPGAGARALSLVPVAGSHEEILRRVGTGVLVQSVVGMHSGVSPVSGDFSVGASGLMIRDGALAEPVQEMTIGSTLQRMLRGVTHIGEDLRWFGGSAGVTLAFAEVALGGR